MNISLKKKKLSLVSLAVLLFLLINTIIIFKFEKIDRTVLISETHTTKKGTLKETLKTEGEAEPSEISKVFYEEQLGLLNEILVDEGQEVEVGTPLLDYNIKSDRSNVISELENANKRLTTEIEKLNDDIALLQAEIAEYGSLQAASDNQDEGPDFDNTRILEYEIKNKEYEIKMTELQIEENQTQIDIANSADDQITIESKIAGTIVQRNDFNRTPDNPLLTIMNQNSLVVNVLVGEDDIQRIKVDQEVTIKPKHLESKLITGKVIKISNIPFGEDQKKDKSFYNITVQPEDQDETTDETAEEATEEITEEKDETADSQLLIGSHVTANITLKELNNVIVLPRETLAGNHVVLIEKGMLKQKKITAGLEFDGKVAVTKGLKEKQQILPIADASVSGDTRYIKSVDFDHVNKKTFKQFDMEERLLLLARGIIQ